MNRSSNNTSIAGLLYQHSPRLLIVAVLIGALAGALYSLIIPFVLQGIDEIGSTTLPDQPSVGVQNALKNQPAFWFFIVVFVILVTKASAVILVNNIAKSATANLKLRIANKINKAKISHVEMFGFPRLMTILTDDVNNVASAAIAIPMLVVSTVTIIGMLGYLASLSLSIFGITVAAIIVGVIVYQTPVAFAHKLYLESRDLKDTIQEGIKGLVMGAYELKLSREKSVDFLVNEIDEPQRKIVRKEKLGDAIIHLAGTSSDLLSFFIIGFMVFALPHLTYVPAGKVYGIVMALLYIAGPVAHILGLMQQLQMGRVAVARINEWMALENEEFQADQQVGSTWREYSVSNLSYRYPQGTGNRCFGLTPVSLSFRKGQINFIVGGNGSGKTTLSKLLSLHYLPDEGVVKFDGQEVDSTNRATARRRIAVIFSNYYLFSKIHRKLSNEEVARIHYFLCRLGLQDKTTFDGKQFSTTKLSDGQRRRLALLIALLEDKDIYVFDEWAADQDPEFKNIFYTEILPELKADNKLIIAITHDDRFFNYCDRMIVMEDGKVVNIKNNVGSNAIRLTKPDIAESLIA